jgi:hypothetical protein
MGWADLAKKELSADERTEVRPRRHTMAGLFEDREPMELEPTTSKELQVGDIVLARRQ